MSSKLIKFELNGEGVRELLRGQPMQDILLDHAHRVANGAGDGYSVYVGPNRANVSVMAETEEAYQDNLENNTLEKVIRS